MRIGTIQMRFGIICAVGFFPLASFGAAAISESSPYNGITLYDVVDYVTDAANKSGGTFGSGRQIHYQLAAISLTASGISFSDTPNNGSASNETNTQTTKSYLTQTGAAVAINANYFNFDGSATTNLVSLETSAATNTAPWPTGAGTSVPGINISATNQVTFIRPANGSGYASVDISTGAAVSLYNAIGSNYMSVKGNMRTGVVDDGADFARSSIGIKGNTLYFFTDTDISEGDGLGLLPTEVGQILHDQWGLSDVLNLDGGGSTQMAIRTTRGATYANTPASANSPRAVGSNLAVYATNAPSAFNKLDHFETTDPASGLTVNGTGHFYGTPQDSGSNVNVKSTSTAARDTTTAHTGSGSMQLKINDSSATAGFKERFLSAGAHAYTNVRFASSGYFGMWIKTSTPNITVSPVIDDDFDGADLVEGVLRTVTADDQWHLYQWNMADTSQWQNFVGDSDGHITNPGVNLNSIWFDSTVSENATINFDDVGWTETGAIPEPAAMALAMLCTTAVFGIRPYRTHARSRLCRIPECSQV